MLCAKCLFVFVLGFFWWGVVVFFGGGGLLPTATEPMFFYFNLIYRSEQPRFPSMVWIGTDLRNYEDALLQFILLLESTTVTVSFDHLGTFYLMDILSKLLSFYNLTWLKFCCSYSLLINVKPFCLFSEHFYLFIIWFHWNSVLFIFSLDKS